MTTILNFSHPFTPAQVDSLTTILGGEVSIQNVATQFDATSPFTPQAVTLVDSVGFTADQWSAGGLVVNLPAMSTIAGLVLAELHGRMGHFPRIVRLVRLEDGTFAVAEVVSLQTVRDTARTRR